MDPGVKNSDLASSIGDNKARDQPREPGAQSVISTAAAKDQEQPNSVAEGGTEQATGEPQSTTAAQASLAETTNDQEQQPINSVAENDGSSGESIRGGLTDSQAFLDESAKEPINGVAEGSTEQATSEPQSQTKADQLQTQNDGGAGESTGGTWASLAETANYREQQPINSVAEGSTEPATSEVQSQIKADELQTQNDGSSGESVKGGLTDSQAFLDKSATKDPINGVAEGSTEQATSEPQSQTGKADQIKQVQNGGGTGEFAGRGPTTNSSSEEVSQLVSGIRIARDQLDKLLDCYGQATPSPNVREKRCKKFPGLFYSFNFCLTILLAVLACCVAWYSEREKLGTFDLEGFFIQNPETAGKWEQLDRRAIRILVTGKTGTGKSALINGLIGRNVTKEGDTLDPTTARVEQIKQMVHGISMSVFDSPGLQDGTSREREYLQDMQQKCEKVDLVLYAIKMTDQRVHAADTKAMKKITDAFGHKFWEKAIFVMTFANEVRSPEYPDDDYENRKYFDKRLQDWIDKLPGFIEQRGDIPLNIGKHVPIVPAGYYKIRDLPGRKFWFSQFWKAALDRMMESSAEGAGYMLQFSQDRLKHYNDTTEEDFEKPIHEQPILSKIVEE